MADFTSDQCWYVAEANNCVVVTATNITDAIEKAKKSKMLKDKHIRTVRHATDDDVSLHGIYEPVIFPAQIIINMPVQTVELRCELSNGYLFTGTIEILKVWHHVCCIRVKDEPEFIKGVTPDDQEDLIEPMDDTDDDLKDMFEDMNKLNPGAMHTVNLPGLVGRYVMCIYPFAD